jgi:hypothetical protein
MTDVNFEHMNDLPPTDSQLMKQGRNEVLTKLLEAGFSVETLSATTGISRNIIVKLEETAKLTPAEETIADMSRELLVKGLNHAMKLMDMGSPETKFLIMMKLLPSAMKLIGRSDSTSSDMEQSLGEVFTLMRTVPALSKVRDADAS